MWVHSHVHLNSLGHISVRVCVCVYIAVPFFLQVIPSDFISLHLLVCLLCIRFACFLSWGHIPVRGGVYAWLCTTFCKIIPSDLTWVLSLVRLLCILFVRLFSLDHIPVRVLVCVCKWLCSSFCIIIQIMLFLCIRLWFFLLLPHPSASVCVRVCVCMAVPFFLHHYSSDVIAVHSLVFHYSSGHIQCMSLSVYVRVCVFVCMAMPIFFTFIHLMSFQSICMCVTFPGSTSQYKCFVCVYVHGFALLIAPLSDKCHRGSFTYVSLFLGPHPSASVCVCAWLCALLLHLFSCDVIWVHSLVRHSYLGHIPVLVCECIAVPFFL